MTAPASVRPLRCERCGGGTYHDRDYYESVMRCLSCGRVVLDLRPPRPEPDYEPLLTRTEDLVLTRLEEYGRPVTSAMMAQLASRRKAHVDDILMSLTGKGLLLVELKVVDGRQFKEWRVKR